MTDNVAQIQDSFSVTKVFDNKLRSFRPISDPTVGELDIKVTFNFSTREVKHNSALNADFMKALQKSSKREMMYSFLTDYELNYR